MMNGRKMMTTMTPCTTTSALPPCLTLFLTSQSPIICQLSHLENSNGTTSQYECSGRACDERKKVLGQALLAIQCLLWSKKTQLEGGENGLQAYRARAIQSYLTMVVKRGHLSVDASERAAKSQGFAAKWGGRNLRLWTCAWIRERCLPQSKKGWHGKVYML